MNRLKEIKWRIDRLAESHPGACFGPGHAVIDDWNLDAPCIERCIQKTLNVLQTENDPDDRAMLSETLALLKWLLSIPEAERVPPELAGNCYCPDCRPELYQETKAEEP